MVLGCISISNGNQKQKRSTVSRFPQIGFDARQPGFLVPLSLGGVFFRLVGREKRPW